MQAITWNKLLLFDKRASEWVFWVSEWVTATPDPKSKDMGRSLLEQVLTFKRILSHFDVKFSLWPSNMHLCTAWMYMFGMNKWTFSFFPRRKYNIIIYNRHPPTGGGAPWRMNEKWVIKKTQFSVGFQWFLIFFQFSYVVLLATIPREI